MTTNGLGIGLPEFKKMNGLDRDIVMFQNFEHLKGLLSNYQTNKKIQYVWLSVLTVVVLAVAGLRKFIPI